MNSSITMQAFHAIENENILLEKYATPDAVLDYLLDDSHFKTLSDLLRETMIEAGVCPPETTPESCADILYNRLVAQDTACGRQEQRTQITVRRWFTGKARSIRYREDVVEICFALGLTAPAAITLMNKCGFNGLSARSAEDATWLYCLLTGRPLATAEAILRAYHSSASLENEIHASPAAYTNPHSGETTLFLEKSLMEKTVLMSEDQFLRSFLMPNKECFIGYATTAVKEYYLLKNHLYIVVFLDAVGKEAHLVAERNRNPASGISQEDIPFSLALRSALRKCKPSSTLSGANALLKEDMSNAKEALLLVREIGATRQETDAQKEISVFLSDIMKAEGFLKYTVDSIRARSGRLRRYRESALRDTVMKSFPNDKTFAHFETDPAGISQGMTLRKVVILMYYIAYAYEFSEYLTDYNYVSQFFGEMGFGEFMEGLNAVLDRCRLPKLYPANQFDWLILRSIREFEIADMDDAEDPVEFFNQVLRDSF